MTEAERRGTLLRELDLLHSDTQSEFDDLVALATLVCGKPMGALTLLDETTQLAKSRVGLSGSPTMPVRDSLCQHTVQGTGLMMVEDLDTDNTHQASRKLCDAGIRFYAGMPLFSGQGLALGALCVMDTQPASLTLEQQHALAILSRQASYLIALRQHALAMQRIAAERDRAQKMLDTILDHVPVGIYLKDREGRLRFYNRSIAEHFQIDREVWIGKSSWDLWDEQTARELAREDNAVFESGVAHASSVTVPDGNGSMSHWKSFKVPCLNADGEQMLACCSIDLTEQMRREAELRRVRNELEEANQKLSSLALTDALTGLWNRRAFDARLETSIMAAQRSKQPLTLMLIDVDHFKRVNDQFGHPYGDTVLKDVVGVLNRSKRGEDIACRFGGEEFAVLMPGTDLHAARHLANRMLEATHSFAWEKIPVTVSIGLAMCTEGCLSDDLVDNADAALYRAKREGRDRCILHEVDSEQATR